MKPKLKSLPRSFTVAAVVLGGMVVFAGNTSAACWKLRDGSVVATAGNTPPRNAIASWPCNQAGQYQGQQQNYQQNRVVGGVCSSVPKVYECQRRLGTNNAQTTTARGFSVVSHSYLCVRTPYGYTCGGQTSGGNGRGANDNLSVYSPNLCREVSAGSGSAAACVINRLAQSTRPSYSVAGRGTNCHEYASDVLAACGLR